MSHCLVWGQGVTALRVKLVAYEAGRISELAEERTTLTHAPTFPDAGSV